MFLLKDQRLKKASINSLLMLIIRGVSILISLFYVPLLLNSLTPSAYGVWLTLASFITWIALFDIGLGNGLRNKLTVALANNDISLAKKYVSTAYATIFILILIISSLFLSIYKLVPWYDVLGADSSIDDLPSLALIVFISFAFNFSFSLITSIINAFQIPVLSSIITTIGQLLSFFVVLILVHEYKTHSLLLLGTVISVIPPLVLLLSSVILFSTKFRHILPSIKHIRLIYAKDIMSLGIQFFILQIITLILYQSNNFIITHTINSEAVAEYNIAYKYMTLPLMIFNILVVPMWSATTDAYSRGEMSWIKNVTSKINKVAFVLSIIGILLLSISDIVLRIWIRSDDIVVHFPTLVLLCLYSISMMYYGAYGNIINGIGKLRVQMLFTSLTALVYIPLSVFAGQCFGLNGILIIFVLSTVLNVIWAKVQLSMIINCKAKGIWDK